jgi:hypothetical protein
LTALTDEANERSLRRLLADQVEDLRRALGQA